MQWEKACYGVDLEGNKLVVVRAERSRGHVKCASVAAHDLTFRESLQKGAACIGCLSARESFTRWLEAPFSSFRKARKVLPTLLDIELPFPLEECLSCFVGERQADDNRTRALAVVARITDVRKKLAALSAKGVNPVALDQEGLALWTQTLRDLPPGTDSAQDAPRVLVSLGSEHWTLVVGRGRDFMNAHGVRARDVSQINRLLRVSLEGSRQIQWVWTGPGASHAPLVADLLKRLGSDWPGPSFVHDEPETFLARALATRALLPEPLRCNLRSGEWTHPSIVEEARRQLVRAAVLLLSGGILLCALNLGVRTLLIKREARIDRAFASLADRMAGYHVKAKGQHALKIVCEKVNAQRQELEPFLDVFRPSLTVLIASAVDIAVTHDLRYEMLSLSRKHVAIRGTAVDWNRCDRLSEYFEQEGIAVKLHRAEVLDDERIPFTIVSEGSND